MHGILPLQTTLPSYSVWFLDDMEIVLFEYKTSSSLLKHTYISLAVNGMSSSFIIHDFRSVLHT